MRVNMAILEHKYQNHISKYQIIVNQFL